MGWARRGVVAWFAGIACGVAAGAPASRTEPAKILAAAEHYVTGLGPPGTIVHAQAGPLDARLQLAACAGDLTPYAAPGARVQARMLVGVRCPDAGGWSILVPVIVESDAPVLVARRALARGELPGNADVGQDVRRVAGLGNQYPAKLADITGRRLKRAVAPGEALVTDALAAPVLIERGQQVTLLAQLDGIAVRAMGVALQPGGHGDRVRARNLASGKIVEGRVLDDGTISATP
jgi:flagella basal body P-ring formation protein FlgA